MSTSQRLISIFLLSISLIGLNASAANAYTTYRCEWRSAPGVVTYECYRDYSWWEFKRDGWYPVFIRFV